MSQATASAMERTRARSSAARGSSGGSGWVSSRYSMMASDWPSTAPPSSSAGTSPWGFFARYSGVRCAPGRRSTGTVSYAMPFRLSAMRTRYAAELRK